MAAAIAVSAVALFTVGATLTRFTGRSPLLSGARMLVIGAAAAGITFAIGSLFHVSTG